MDKKQKNNTLLRQCLFFSFIFGFLAHGFFFSNFNPSHDSLVEVMGWWFHQATLGRFFATLYSMVFSPRINTVPWTNGLFGLLWLALASYNAVKMLKIEGKVPIAILCGIMVTNITVTAICATYMECFGWQMLSVLFAVRAGRNWDRMTFQEVRNKRILYAILCTADLYLVMGLYPANVSIFITLVIMREICEIISNYIKPGLYLKEIFHCLVGAISLGIAGILYNFSLKPACELFGVSLSSGEYNSVTNIYTNAEPLLSRGKAALSGIIDAIIHMPGYVIDDKVLFFINIALIACGCILLILQMIRLSKNKSSIINLLFVSGLVLIYPFCVNCIRMINQSVHILMANSYWIGFYILFLAISNIYYNSKDLSDNAENKFLSSKKLSAASAGLSYVCYALLSVIVLLNIETANVIYIKKNIEYDAALSVMTRVLDRIEKIEGFDRGSTPVAFSGTPNEYFDDISEFSDVSEIVGIGPESPISYVSAYQSFFSTILKRDIYVLMYPNSELRAYMDLMPSFPADNSVQLVDGVVVVKL